MAHKFAIVTALLVGTLTSGCSNAHTEEEQGYLASVKYYKTQEVLDKSDEELIAIGRYTCELFDNNVTPNQVIVKVVKRGNLQTGAAISDIMTSALLGFCPEYSDVLNYG